MGKRPSRGRGSSLSIIVDTSVLISLERARRSPAEHLPGNGLLPAIVLAELMLGPNRGVTSRQRQEANAFVADVRQVLTVIPFGEDEAARCAQLWVQLQAEGHEIGDHDLQIAATALVGAHDLMTYNVKEFQNVPGLRLVAAPDL